MFRFSRVLGLLMALGPAVSARAEEAATPPADTVTAVPAAPAREVRARSPWMAGALGLVPGVGQFYNRRKTRGLVFASVGAVVWGGAVYFGIRAGDARQDYDDAPLGSDFPSLRRDATRSWTAYMVFGTAALLVSSSSATEAYLDARRTGAALAVLPRGGLALQWSAAF